MLSVLYFTAEWCGPCRAFRPIISEIQTKYSGKMDLQKIDIDKNPEITREYNIRSVPTLIFLKDGVEVFKNSGIIPKPQFESIINNYV